MIEQDITCDRATILDVDAHAVRPDGEWPVHIVIIVFVFPVIVFRQFDGTRVGDACRRTRSDSNSGDVVGVFCENFAIIGDGIVGVDRNRGGTWQVAEINFPIFSDCNVVGLSVIRGGGLDGSDGGFLDFDGPCREGRSHTQNNNQSTCNHLRSGCLWTGSVHP